MEAIGRARELMIIGDVACCVWRSCEDDVVV